MSEDQMKEYDRDVEVAAWVEIQNRQRTAGTFASTANGEHIARELNASDDVFTNTKLYGRIASEIGILLADKQQAYGKSFQNAGAIMRILYPNGVAPEQMDDALTVTRIIDKLFRIATKKDAYGESPYKDIAGYAILGVAHLSKDSK